MNILQNDIKHTLNGLTTEERAKFNGSTVLITGCAGFLGYYTGRNIKELWILPVVPAVLFLLGAHLIYKMAFKTYIIHFFIYLLISYIAALVSVKKRKKSKI